MEMKCLTWPHRFCILERVPDKIKEIFNNHLNVAGFGVVDFYEYYLDNGIYIAEWVLEESHFVVWVSPKYGVTFCEISSCNLKKYIALLELVEPISVSVVTPGPWAHKFTSGITDHDELERVLRRFLDKSDIKILGFQKHFFPGEQSGCTITIVFGNGVVNAHTFKEDKDKKNPNGKTSVEVTLFDSPGVLHKFINMAQSMG